MVSIKIGLSAESLKASRRRMTALLIPCSKSTKMSEGQSACRNSSRVITSPGRVEQQRERTKRQVLQTDPDAVPPEFARAQVGFEHTEANQSRRRLWRAHKDEVWGRALSLHRIQRRGK